jgi:glycosyltransferase involved in cell wall biosynthesis
VRIVLLVTDLEPGGTPLRVARYARGLRERGVVVSIGCLAKVGAVGRALFHDGFDVFGCDAKSARDLWAISRLSEQIRIRHPRLIHSALTHANVCARIVGRWRQIPVIGSTATIEVERRWHLRLERATAWMESAHVVNSRAVAQHVHRSFGLPQHRIELIPPFLDPAPLPATRAAARDALGIDDSTYLVAWMGRFDVVKRVDALVDAMKFVSDERVQLLLIGDGPQRESIDRQIRHRGLAGRVRITGWLDNPRNTLPAADLFCFPSRTEGLPNSILEAFLCRVPVLASDITAIRELSPDSSRIAFLTEADPRHIAHQIETIRSDTAAAISRSDAAYRFVTEELGPDRSIDALMQLYRRVT